MKFIDEAKITIESGKGGAGLVSFRREKFIPRGGPDGGDGGRGGHIIFKVSQSLNSLLHLKFKKTYKAQNGEPGGPAHCTGKDGQDLTIEVPSGTVIRDSNGQTLVELDGFDQEVVLLKGGRGGKGNSFFKSSVNQAPMHAQPGEEGLSSEIVVELKLLADVGIIGLPNAGKSTLISRISSAKPKIAEYPFTTLVPHLGVVRTDENTTLVVADIPGLIPGAHKGMGLGIQFLKHIEKTKCFLHLIDISEMNILSPQESFDQINEELKAYDGIKEIKNPLSKRKQIVVLNKADTVDLLTAQSIKNSFEQKGIKAFVVSSVSGFGIREMLFGLKDVIEAENANN